MAVRRCCSPALSNQSRSRNDARPRRIHPHPHRISEKPMQSEHLPNVSRRHFLRGVGVGVALPFFESARLVAADPVPGAKLAVTATGAPLRTAFVYFPNGAIPAAWWPTGE